LIVLRFCPAKGWSAPGGCSDRIGDGSDDDEDRHDVANGE
jgi:hypothetical protein